MACAYCYVPRNKGYSNPVTVFANIEQITGALERHATRQGLKLEPNQCDPELWVYDIGENSDCSVDALISDNVEDLVTLFRDLPTAKLTDAAKAQLAAEVIFLTHNERLHEVNLGWHPQAEDVLWRPDLQESKVSSNGFTNVRYRSGAKAGYVRQLTALIAEIAPYCRIRYAF